MDFRVGLYFFSRIDVLWVIEEQLMYAGDSSELSIVYVLEGCGFLLTVFIDKYAAKYYLWFIRCSDFLQFAERAGGQTL